MRDELQRYEYIKEMLWAYATTPPLKVNTDTWKWDEDQRAYYMLIGLRSSSNSCSVCLK
jgi:hypothetical protein